MWCALLTNLGTILLGNWYRPPDDDGSSLDGLAAAISRLQGDVIGILLVGDVNIHHQRWLHHSHSNTAVGERLWNICRDAGLKQLVKEPTRKQYLLDLVLSNIPELVKVTVLPEISDHRVVNIEVNAVVSISPAIERTVWMFTKADWDGLKADFSSTDWKLLFQDIDPEGSVHNFCNYIETCCIRRIPRRVISTRICSHPWLDAECIAAVQAKCAAAWSDEFRTKELECERILTKAFVSYRQSLRERILSLPRSSKQWWKYNKELLNRPTKASSISPLKNSEGTWVTDPAEKAALLAAQFQRKSVLPAPVGVTCALNLCTDKNNQLNIKYGAGTFAILTNTATREVQTRIRCRVLLKIMSELNPDKTSGPDGLPVKIFRECRAVLAVAIAMLVRFVLRHKFWPSDWRRHHIHPLFKKGSVSMPGNYRGVHLTNVLSKIVERAIATFLTPFFDKFGYGIDQWAFRRGRSCRDLVALLISRWIWALDNGFKIALYLSDISGAFDRVDREILTQRLRDIGLPTALVDFLYAYLAPREATVVVQGSRSPLFAIFDEVFQGTVLGPPLWNIFFEPIDEPIRCTGFRIAKFADDLSAYRNYESSVANSQILTDLRHCQGITHKWGMRNRAIFDNDKEHFCILHKADCVGDVFRLLGVSVDPKLTMEDEIRRIKKKASPKISAILQTRAFYSLDGLLQQYKAHVLCILEGSVCAIYHAAQSHLNSLDELQRRFVEKLGLTESEAFLRKGGLAPLELRRDIAVLGFLHKIQLGNVHPDLHCLFPREIEPPAAPTRSTARRHSLQFREHTGNSMYFKQSLFGAVTVYNFLPTHIVEARSVKTFQSMLTMDARRACQAQTPGWQTIYNCRIRSWR